MMSSDIYKLTSVSIQCSPSGSYSFDEIALLAPHEAIRRETIRAEWAIQCLDIESNPWKARNFAVWVREFYAECIKDHHDNEEKIMFPFYRKLMIMSDIPQNQLLDHEKLTLLLSRILFLADDMESAVNIGELTVILIAKKEMLQTVFAEYKEILFAHLADEETFWPQVILKNGKDQFEKMHQQIVIAGGIPPSHAARMIGCSVINALGVSIDDIPAESIGDIAPWCNEKLGKEFYANIPWIARAFFFPCWNRKYQRYKTMIQHCQLFERPLDCEDLFEKGTLDCERKCVLS